MTIRSEVSTYSTIEHFPMCPDELSSSTSFTSPTRSEPYACNPAMIKCGEKTGRIGWRLVSNLLTSEVVSSRGVERFRARAWRFRSHPQNDCQTWPGAMSPRRSAAPPPSTADCTARSSRPPVPKCPPYSPSGHSRLRPQEHHPPLLVGVQRLQYFLVTWHLYRGRCEEMDFFSCREGLRSSLTILSPSFGRANT